MIRSAKKQPKTSSRFSFNSIQTRFFFGIAAASFVFVAVLMLLNLVFFNQYNLFQKQHQLVKIYQNISSTYTGNISDIRSSLEEIESSSNVRISITNDYGQYTYDTMYSADRNMDFSSSSVSRFSTFSDEPQYIYYDSDEIQKNGYSITTVMGRHSEKSYLALIAPLSTGELLILRIPYASIQQDHLFNLTFLLISGALALIVCLVLGYMLSARFAKPLKEMTEVADSVARLDFSKKYQPTNTTNEIRLLGESINQMSDYLDQSISELKEMNIRLETEIEQKQKIDDMRKEFIINISHELKTPIALIQGYAEGLKVGISESEEDKDYYCDIIMDEARRMNHLVLQLLNLSKIELGNTLPIYTEFEWYELAESVISKTRVMWQEKQLHIDMSGIGDETVCADWDMMEQAVTNYVTNAIDHTPEGGTISLSSDSDRTHEIFKVRNQGSHLDEAEMEKIWDKFYKLDKARTRISGGGSGIGLSIVRAMMHAHHGGCGVTNTEDGVEFYLTLPKHPDLSQQD